MIRFKNCISTVEFLRSLPKAEAGLDLEGPGEFSGLIKSAPDGMPELPGAKRILSSLVLPDI